MQIHIWEIGIRFDLIKQDSLQNDELWFSGGLSAIQVRDRTGKVEYFRIINHKQDLQVDYFPIEIIGPSFDPMAGNDLTKLELIDKE